jgi:hypothetical protein
MTEFFEMRITRYRDAESFQMVVEMLSRLFPRRSREELAAGLAVTPVHLTHSATPMAAHALEQVLVELGASVSVKTVDEASTSTSTLEVNDEFLTTLSQRRKVPIRRPDPEPETPAPSSTAIPSASVKPPWEQD